MCKWYEVYPKRNREDNVNDSLEEVEGGTKHLKKLSLHWLPHREMDCLYR